MKPGSRINVSYTGTVDGIYGVNNESVEITTDNGYTVSLDTTHAEIEVLADPWTAGSVVFDLKEGAYYMRTGDALWSNGKGDILTDDGIDVKFGEGGRILIIHRA